MITCMEMKSFILKYASKIMFYDVNIACYQKAQEVDSSGKKSSFRHHHEKSPTSSLAMGQILKPHRESESNGRIFWRGCEDSGRRFCFQRNCRRLFRNWEDWPPGLREREIEIDGMNYDTYHRLGYGKGGERSML